MKQQLTQKFTNFKKLLTICLILAVSFAVKAQEQKEYYDNGQLKTIGNFTDQKQVGEWKYYHENGKLSQIGKFINGKTNGEWKFYHENGQLKQIANYIDGKGNGEWKNYQENGQLSQIGNYIDNISTGEWKFYNENGELIGKKLYDVNGKEIAQERKEYYNNGQLKSVGNYTDGKGSGELKFYHENGQLKSVGNFTNGKGSGEWKFYRENGKLESNRNYIDGKLNGEEKMYSENGNLQQVRNYKDDIQNGTYKYYSKSGHLSSIGNYTNGKETGEWQSFNDNGVLISKKLYDVEGKEIETKNTKIIEGDYDYYDDYFDFGNFILPELRKGVDLLEKKEYKNAIIEFDAFIKKNPHKIGSKCDCDAYFYRGKANYFLGNYKEAIDDYSLIIESSLGNPKLQEGLYYRGLSKINLKQMDAGCLDLYKAKDKFPDAEEKIKIYCK